MAYTIKHDFEWFQSRITDSYGGYDYDWENLDLNVAGVCYSIWRIVNYEYDLPDTLQEFKDSGDHINELTSDFGVFELDDDGGRKWVNARFQFEIKLNEEQLNELKENKDLVERMKAVGLEVIQTSSKTVSL